MAWVKAQMGNALKHIICNNAKEYICNGTTMKKWCDKNGVELVPLTRYTPNKNSIAEKGNEQCENGKQALLLHVQLLKQFWVEVSHTFQIIDGRTIIK